MGWIVFSGENGIDAMFEGGKHRSNEALVPFKTKQKSYEDFSGVVGAFCRIMSDADTNGKVDLNTLYTNMRKQVDDCSEEDFKKLFAVVKDLYFSDGSLLPINVKALNYIDSNVTQRQVAEYIYSLFVDQTELKMEFENMEEEEESNVLENLVFSSLGETNKKKEAIQESECYLPYVKEMFDKDISFLMQNNDYFKDYIERLLAYYYMFYVTQLAVKLWRFDKGNREEIEKIYLTLNWEVVTRVRPGYEYGWKMAKDAISHMFSHAIVMEMISHNKDGKLFDYIGLNDRMLSSPEDEQAAAEIDDICERYKNWWQLDYSKCKHDTSKDGECKTSNAVRRLFDTIDFQFINGTRKSHYDGYNRKFIEFVQKNFGKWRGTLGYSLGINENDIVMFTQIILGQNQGKIRLSKLYEEFEKRGLFFDRESKRKISDLYEKMNLLEKRSDSGDAQYVKSVL